MAEISSSHGRAGLLLRCHGGKARPVHGTTQSAAAAAFTCRFAAGRVLDFRSVTQQHRHHTFGCSMDQPPPPPPPTSPEPAPPTAPSPTPPPFSPTSHYSAGAAGFGSAPAGSGRAKWPWILGGCGCLALVGIIVAVAILAWVSKNSNPGKRSSQSFDPYRGSVAALLPKDMSDSISTYTLSGTSDRTSEWKSYGATDAVGFTYMQKVKVMNVGVKIDGALVNFPSAADAVAALKKTAAEENGTVSTKGSGQRFTAEGGQMIGWTNGSLLCVVKGSTDPAAGNFETVAPF